MNPQVPEPAKRSLATELFTRWLSDPKWRDKGEPLRALPRHGASRSFDGLAQSVTKDVHPRTLLEEMSRLGLVRLDEGSDTVHLLRESFVPAGDEQRMLSLLGANVGDHLCAAVSNVLGETPRQLEQAMFADELSPDSIERLQPLVREQWQVLLRQLAPAVQTMIDEDQVQKRQCDQRLRIGMYTYAGAMPHAAGKPATETAEQALRPRRNE